LFNLHAVVRTAFLLLPTVETLRGHEDWGTNAEYLTTASATDSTQSSRTAEAKNESNYYYHHGRFQYQFDPELSDQALQNGKVMYLLDRERPMRIGPHARLRDLYESLPNKTQRQMRFVPRTLPVATDTWVLPNPLLHPTRNHDTVILPASATATGNNVAIHLLGRHCRHVQQMDLETGAQNAVQTHNLTDPDGRPLDDLNHVSAVLVRAVRDNNDDAEKEEPDQWEIWLPCGFHGDVVNGEISSTYVRIVDVTTLQVRYGPRLPEAGGACVATAANILPNEPPMICVAGGTDGTHDRGRFLRQTYCYDRVRHVWHSPFGRLPYGLDHGSLAVIEPGVCHPDDPQRWLILNFRTKPYGDAHSEILAFDWPRTNGFWTLADLQDPTKSTDLESWYIYHNGTEDDHLRHPEAVGRDASGVVVASRRHIVNFGGTYHYWTTSTSTTTNDGDGTNNETQTQRRKRGRFSLIRSFDVCTKQWSIVGDLGFRTFALQSTALNHQPMVVTCGGEAPTRHGNGPWCFLTRFHNGMEPTNRYNNDRYYDQ
jgi:hypothetical protein